jgi:RNA polymerase sigma factor (sigma-70 family)
VLPGVRLAPDRGYARRVSDTSLGSDSADSLGIAFGRGEVDLREIYEAHSSLVYAICRKAVGADAAAEVTQDVFLSAWRGRAQFDPERGNLTAWLVGITKRRVIDHLRREQRHADRRADDDVTDRVEAVPGPADPSVERIAQRMVVARALATLADRPREAVELAYVHGLTHAEIAERTGHPLGTVKSDIRRGLRVLRDHLESDHG